MSEYEAWRERFRQRLQQRQTQARATPPGPDPDPAQLVAAAAERTRPRQRSYDRRGGWGDPESVRRGAERTQQRRAEDRAAMLAAGVRVCGGCGEAKPLAAYPVARNGPDRVSIKRICRECHNARKRQQYADDRARRRGDECLR